MAKWIMSEGFLGTAREVRTVWLSGIFGTGKTLSSVAIAAWLLQNGWASSFISNIPVNGQDEPTVPMEHCVVLLDEAHLFLPDWNSVRAYSSFLRKVNMRLLMPSVYPPHSKLRILEIQRVFNGYRMLGSLSPFWAYKWRVNAGMFSEKGSAILWCPHHLFGVYDTDIILAEDADEKIMHSVTETIARKSGKALAEQKPVRIDKNARQQKRSSAAIARQNARGKDGRFVKQSDAQTIADAANTFTDAAASIGDSLESLTRRIKR